MNDTCSCRQTLHKTFLLCSTSRDENVPSTSKSTHTIKGRAGYTVVCLSEIKAPTTNIHSSALTDQAGPSKKQKIN